MFRLIYRQRRRILFGTFFLIIFAIISFDAADLGFLASIEVWWQKLMFLALLFAIMSAVLMPIIALFIAIFPRWRHIIELLSFFMFLEASVDRTGILDPLAPYIGVAGPFIWFLSFMAFYTLTYGVGLDRFHAMLSWKSMRSAKVPQSAEETWRKFATHPDFQDDHWDPLLHKVEALDEPDTFEVEYTMGASVFQHQTQTILENVPGRKFRYHFMGEVNPKNQSLSEGIFDVSLEPVQEDCRISLTEHQSSLMPRDALAMWFDDYLGDRLDSYLAKVRGKRDWSISGLIRRQILSYS